jgi:hypothetical protein
MGCTSLICRYAAPFHSCKYRWLHAPATNCTGTSRSPVSGDLLVFWAAVNIAARHRLERRQRHLGLPGADARTADLDLAPAEHDGTPCGARASAVALHLMLVARPTDGGPIFLEHGLQHFHARSHHELGQLRPRVNQQIDEGQVAGFRFLGLVAGVDCARLLRHGGSFVAAFAAV